MVPDTVDALDWLRKHLEGDGNDLIREMVQAFAERLMAAEADAMCGAGYGERSAERVNSRNGYRHRELDTGPARSIWRSRSCGRAPTTRGGSSSRAGGRSEP